MLSQLELESLARSEVMYPFLLEKVRSLATRLSDKVQVTVNPNGLFFTGATREDLQLVMSLAPDKPFSKMVSGEEFTYYRTDLFYGEFIFGYYITTSELPSTCKVIYEDVLVPARKAFTRKVAKIVCNERETKPQVSDVTDTTEVL